MMIVKNVTGACNRKPWWYTTEISTYDVNVDVKYLFGGKNFYVSGDEDTRILHELNILWNGSTGHDESCVTSRYLPVNAGSGALKEC